MSEDKNAVAMSGQGGGAVVARSVEDARGMLAMIAEAARDPTVDAEKMVTLANLAMSMQDRERQTEYNRDKVAALIAMPSITKKGEIIIPGKDGRPGRMQGKYVKFEDLQAIVGPILAGHNLVLSFNIGHNGPMVSVQPILSHTNGTVEKGEFMSVPLDTSGSKNNTQGAGSAASYAKRYAAVAMLNLRTVGEDDDGVSAGGGSPASDLSPEASALMQAGGAAAEEGPSAYLMWFQGLSTAEKGWLVTSRHHEKFKKRAEA